MIYKPSEKEEEYFKRLELEKLKKLREEERKKMETEERRRLKELHWMRCPKCGLELTEVEYRGIMVDLCLGCGGMFFDKGEVEKLLDDAGKGLIRSLLKVF